MVIDQDVSASLSTTIDPGSAIANNLSFDMKIDKRIAKSSDGRIELMIWDKTTADLRD